MQLIPIIIFRVFIDKGKLMICIHFYFLNCVSLLHQKYVKYSDCNTIINRHTLIVINFFIEKHSNFKCT